MNEFIPVEIVLAKYTTPKTFITVSTGWMEESVYVIMPVVACMVGETIEIDVIHGAN